MLQNNMLKEAIALRQFGFAIHWLRPKSKAPFENAWSKAPVKSVKELINQYREGMNVGVRLGKASSVAGGFLSVIDCDVKSTDEADRDLMLDKLVELFGDKVMDFPTVMSGRGNGSQHVYILTKEPVSPKRLAQSAKKVLAHMPSVKPSKSEEKELSPEQLNDGMRSRAAWEISLMGEGQQVVLPPSIHPDSGQEYMWHTDLDKLAFVTPPVTEEKDDHTKTPHSASVKEDFRPEDVDLDLENISKKTVDMIVDGLGVEDRSASLMSAAMSMTSAGMTENQIMSVLTDVKNYLGGVAYDHAQTNSRKKAAEWIRKYTIKKAKHNVSGVKDFNNLVEVSELEPEEALEQEKKIEETGNWRSEIDRVGGKSDAPPKPTLKNIVTILQGTAANNVFLYNEFSASELYGCGAPWGGRDGKEVSDVDLINIKQWLSEMHRMEPSVAIVNEAVRFIANQNRFHPVRNYLDALKWDGEERIDSWLKDYFGAQAPEHYLKAISRKVLCGMVARIYEPGCKFDYVLILEGVQGLRKSSSLEALVGEEWFTDERLDIADKDSVLKMHGKWLVEMGELSGMKKADIDQFKEFVTRRTDRIRMPYGKRAENFPRQCIFIGTTNNDEFLKDETGNRRFWPIKVGRCKLDKLKKIRDQLFAEAVASYQLGEALYLDESLAEAEAQGEQKKRMEHDILIDKFVQYFEEQEQIPSSERGLSEAGFTLSEFFGCMSHLQALGRDDRSTQLRVARCLRLMGFRKIVGKRGGASIKLWRK